jgi:16S rRNA (guanine527-N7)-methyltransferase
MARPPEESSWQPRIERVLAHFATPAGPVGDFARLLSLLVTWNQKMDLTAARNDDELVDLMLADAILLAREEPAKSAHWGDIGSGAGAPGLPLALLLPDARVTLVEPRDKRVAFLRTAIGSLGRPTIDVVRKRSDELLDRTFEIAVARATLPPAEWLAEGARLATRAVWVLLATGEPPSRAGWRIDRDLSYVWPLTGVQRRSVRFVPEAP